MTPTDIFLGLAAFSILAALGFATLLALAITRVHRELDAKDEDIEHLRDSLDRLVGFLAQKRIEIVARGQAVEKELVLGDARDTLARIKSEDE